MSTVLAAQAGPRDEGIESPYAWLRLVASFVLMTIGGSGMYSISIVLPQIQAEHPELDVFFDGDIYAICSRPRSVPRAK